MKKILSIMGSLSLITVASATVISCGAKVNHIETQVGSENFADGVSVNGDNNKKYNINQLANSLSGLLPGTTALSQSLVQFLNPATGSTNTFNNDLLNLLSSVNRKIIQPNNDQLQLRKIRDTFAGREGYEYNSNGAEKSRYLRPTVDGLLMNWEKDDEANLQAYYDSYKTTSINSIEGLYNLANFTGSTSNWSQNLKDSKTMADGLFNAEKGNADAIEFAKLFLGITTNPYHEAAFSQITYGASKTVKDLFKLYQSQSTMFDTKQSIDENSTSLTTLADRTGKFSDVNKFDAEQIAKDEKDNRIYNRKTDPIQRLLPTSVTMPTAPVKELKLVQKAQDENKKDKPDQKLVQLKDFSTVYFYNKTKKGDKDPSYNFVPNQVVYSKVDPLEVEFKFNTNIRDKKDEQAPVYTLSFKLNNLNAIWAPAWYASSRDVSKLSDEEKEAEKSLRQVVWVFVGYKFSNGVDSSLQGFNQDLSAEQLKDLEFESTHRFQDLKITDLKITKN